MCNMKHVHTCTMYNVPHLGVSENSVPLNPMVLLIITPIKWLFHWEYNLFSDKPIFVQREFVQNSSPGDTVCRGSQPVLGKTCVA